MYSRMLHTVWFKGGLDGVERMSNYSQNYLKAEEVARTLCFKISIKYLIAQKLIDFE